MIPALVSAPCLILITKRLILHFPGRRELRELFHFPPLTCYHVPRNAANDLARVGQNIAGLEEREAVRQLYDLRLPVVDVQAYTLGDFLDLGQELPQIFLAMVNHDPIVHIGVIAPEALHGLAIGINRRRKENPCNLRDGRADPD